MSESVDQGKPVVDPSLLEEARETFEKKVYPKMSPPFTGGRYENPIVQAEFEVWQMAMAERTKEIIARIRKESESYEPCDDEGYCGWVLKDLADELDRTYLKK